MESHRGLCVAERRRWEWSKASKEAHWTDLKREAVPVVEAKVVAASIAAGKDSNSQGA